MREATCILGASGLHARPAALLVKMTKQYQSQVTLLANDKSADAGKGIIGIMGLGAGEGVTLTVRTDGPDEEAALAAIMEILQGSR